MTARKRKHHGKILLADGGATKIDWLLLVDGVVARRFTTAGFNAASTAPEAVCASLAALRDNLGGLTPDETLFFGAGCGSETTRRAVERLIAEYTDSRTVTAESDLMAAAIALLGDSAGIACILGTGSNSCLYDGERIVSRVPSLGYVLGDEGSGASIGRRILADSLRGILPADTCRYFLDAAGLDEQRAIESVYRGKAPGSFLGSIARLAAARMDDPAVVRLISEEFSRFVERNLDLYEDARSYPVAFSGGVACGFRPILVDVLASHGYMTGKIIKSPMEGLMEYYA